MTQPDDETTTIGKGTDITAADAPPPEAEDQPITTDEEELTDDGSLGGAGGSGGAG
jgi:hypothetical protein